MAEYIYKTIQVQVGEDVVEAEYFKSNNDFFGLDLNFTLWDKITIPFCRAKGAVKYAYWKIRQGFQRMFKGYDSVDCFDTFQKFIERYSKVLAELRKCHYGHPCNMTEEEWNDTLDKMVYHLHYMDEDNIIKELEKYVEDDWMPCYETYGRIMNKHKDEFFKLFSEYFYNLWD